MKGLASSSLTTSSMRKRMSVGVIVGGAEVLAVFHVDVGGRGAERGASAESASATTADITPSISSGDSMAISFVSPRAQNTSYRFPAAESTCIGFCPVRRRLKFDQAKNASCPPGVSLKSPGLRPKWRADDPLSSRGLGYQVFSWTHGFESRWGRQNLNVGRGGWARWSLPPHDLYAHNPFHEGMNMKSYNIAVIGGDGAGPEVVREGPEGPGTRRRRNSGSS